MSKTTTALGAVVLVVLTAAGLRASFAGDQPKTPKVILPYAETGVEDTAPPPGTPRRLVVNLLEDGSIVFKGRTWSLGSREPRVQSDSLVHLKDELTALTAPVEWRRNDGSSKVALLIRGDRNARWQYAQWIMQVAYDPSIQITRIRLGVRPPPVEGEAGKTDEASRPTEHLIEIDLPRDRGIQMGIEEEAVAPGFVLSLFRKPEAESSPDTPKDAAAKGHTKIRVAFGAWAPFRGPPSGGMIGSANDEAAPLKVLATLRLPSGQWGATAGDAPDAARWKHFRAVRAEIVTAVRKVLGKRGEKPAPRGFIRTPPPFGQAVPFGDVVLALDALREAGIEGVEFEGSMPPSFIAGQGGTIEIK